MREGWIYEEPVDEIEDIIYKVKMLPIATVLSHYGVSFKRITGNRALALCPFHMDNHIGSFSVNITTNSCWCYACNHGGNVIRSVSTMLKKSYVETALQIAADEALITKEQFEKLSSVKYEPKITDKGDFEVQDIEKESLSNGKVALYNDVYEALKTSCSLSEEHKEALLNERGLSKERIKKDYFTMPKSPENVIAKIKRVLNGKYTDEEIATVPGFYLEKAKTDGNVCWKLTFFNFAGLCILLRDISQNAIAVQIRLDNVSVGSRYIFMSGKQSGSEVKGGASIGTVLDYLPCKNESKKIAITEGRFKSEILRQNGYNVISVQGVNNYRGIVPMIKSLGFERVDIFYDADMITNPQVCAACAKLIRYLKNGLSKTKINVIIWDYKDGKGIDDLIFAGKRHTCKSITANDYITAVDHTLEDAIAECGYDKNAPANKFTKEDRDEILSMFESLMRIRLDIREEYQFFE